MKTVNKDWFLKHISLTGLTLTDYLLGYVH